MCPVKSRLEVNILKFKNPTHSAHLFSILPNCITNLVTIYLACATISRCVYLISQQNQWVMRSTQINANQIYIFEFLYDLFSTSYVLAKSRFCTQIDTILMYTNLSTNFLLLIFLRFSEHFY